MSHFRVDASPVVKHKVKRETLFPSTCYICSQISICQAKEWLSSCGCVSCETIGTHMWLFKLLDSTVAKLPETWSLSAAHSMYKSLCFANVKDTGKSVAKMPIEHRSICDQSKLPGHRIFQQRIMNTGPCASALILVT